MRGPKHVVREGKTSVLTAEEARELLDSIPLVRSTGRRRKRDREAQSPKPSLVDPYFARPSARLANSRETRCGSWTAYAMIQRRAADAGIKTKIGNHSFRATGITAYLKNKGTLEAAQHIANHESPRTTKLYDRRSDEISLDEVEKTSI